MELRVLLRFRLVHASDFCAQAVEAFFDFFVAAVNVIHPINGGCAARRQARQHQGRGSPQITGHHRGTDELLFALII